MSGETKLKALLKNMSPKLHDEEYVFITINGQYSDYSNLKPIFSFMEDEGLTLIVPEKIAAENNIKSDSVFKYITLTVHSSLEAVGLTAAVAAKLTEDGISANVVAAYYHDHIFVQSEHAEKAVKSLKELTK